MSSIRRLSLFIAALGLIAPPSYAQESETSFSYAGHGALFDKNRIQLKITPAFIKRAQTDLLDRAENQSTREVRQRFSEIREKLRGFEMDGLHRAFTNAGLIRLLAANEKIDKDNGLTLLEENAGLTRQIRSAFGAPLHWKMDVRKAFDPMIVNLWIDLDLLDFIIFDFSNLISNDYIRSCREEGVPVPNFFGGSGWTKSAFDADGFGPLLQGELENEFILGGAKAIVWGWESNNPRGTCIGLPRGNNGTVGTTVGVICQGNDTPKACFFDNVNDDFSNFTVTEGEAIAMNRFATGPELVAMNGPTGKCAGCHRGENAFIIHPGTALDLTAQGFNLRASGGWYEPLFGPNPGSGWVNPPPSTVFDSVTLGTTSVSIPIPVQLPPNVTATISDRGCNSCHQLPELRPDDNFCGTLVSAGFLQLASERTMPPPPDPPANWDAMQSLHDVAFEKHINALRAECGLSPASKNPTFDWLINPEN